MNIANQERQIMNDGEIVNGIIEQAKVEHAATLENIAKLVHATWRDGMLRQGRPVAPQRLNWDTLEEEDRELDRMIARGIWERLEDKASQFNFGYDCAADDVCNILYEKRGSFAKNDLRFVWFDELMQDVESLFKNLSKSI
jgi:hypothetical protein